ncbi:MAG: TolC family protein [Bacteriovorax sp.]|jgi:outer membrane protein TolC
MNMKKLVGFLLLILVSTVRLYASEEYSLEKAKNQVANNNINISIAYQQYIQVMNESRSKTQQILPTLSPNILLLDYQYSVLKAVIPEPSQFSVASAKKELVRASALNTRIAMKNLLADLEKTYFLFQYHKDLIVSFARELQISAEIAERAQTAYDLGEIDFNEYYKSRKNLITAKSRLVSGNELLKSEEFALKLILQVKDNTGPLLLERIEFYNGGLDYPTSVQSAVNIAVTNSKEVEQYDHLIAAAEKQKRGVGMSWLTWDGVGFDYFSNVAVAKSEVKKIELMKTKAVYEVRNQVASQLAQIDALKEKLAIESELLTMAQTELNRARVEETSSLKSFIRIKQAELNLNSVLSDLLKFRYELEVKYIKLKRLLGTNMLTNTVPRS